MNAVVKEVIEEIDQKTKQVNDEIFAQYQHIIEGVRLTRKDIVITADEKLEQLHMQKAKLVVKKREMLVANAHEEWVREHLKTASQEGCSWRQGSFEDQM